MSSSESSSLPSPSPPASPEASYHGPPSLERIVLHFVAAKKALVSTQYAYRATELVTSSRVLIEEIAILNAKNAFARGGVDDQITTLREMRDGVVDAGEHGDDEFRQTIAKLDFANDRLQSTLGSLKKVMIDPSLHKQGGISSSSQIPSRSDESESGESQSQSQQKTLFDFVDEGNHETLLASLRGMIDSFNDARADLNNNVDRFEDCITSILQTLKENASANAAPSKPTPYDEPPLPIPTTFREMESHASSMAELLHSLVSHYDLCVSALKHTEGGGEAARAAIQAEELAKNAAGSEESLYRTTVPEPMDDKERAEMLRVLENDAAEVEDAVGELKDRAGEMETLYAQLNQRATTARQTTKRLRRAVAIFHQIQESLPVYLDAASVFRTSWTNIQSSIESKTQELVGLCGFYEQFLAGYKKLLREVDRRKAAESQIKKVAEKAQRELERLYEADRVAREGFVDEVGGFLPGDLWPGLAEKGRKWEVTEVAGEYYDERPGAEE